MGETQPFPWQKWAIIALIVVTCASGTLTACTKWIHPAWSVALNPVLAVCLEVVFVIMSTGTGGLLSYWVLGAFENRHRVQRAKADSMAAREKARRLLLQDTSPTATAFTNELFRGLTFCSNPRQPEPCLFSVEMSLLRYYANALEQIRQLTRRIDNDIRYDHSPSNPATVLGHREKEVRYLCQSAEAALANDQVLALARRLPRLQDVSKDGEELARKSFTEVFRSLNVEFSEKKEDLEADEAKAKKAMYDAGRATEEALLAITKVQTAVQKAQDSILNDCHALAKTLCDENSGCAVLFNGV